MYFLESEKVNSRYTLGDRLRGSELLRWHTVHCSRVQTLNEHVANVIYIATNIMDLIEPKVDQSTRLHVVELIMVHDLPEIIEGDPPGRFGKEYQISDLPALIVKVADLLEAMWFAGRYIVDSTRAVKIHARLFSEIHRVLQSPHLHESVTREVTRVVDKTIRDMRSKNYPENSGGES